MSIDLPETLASGLPARVRRTRHRTWLRVRAISLRAARIPLDALVRTRLPVDAFLVAGFVLAAVRFLNVTPWNEPVLDLHVYWATRFGIDYASSSPFLIGAYLYSPAFAQVIRPIALLPWPVFAGLWTALIVAAYVWLVGRWAFPILFSVAVALELYLGQIDIFLAAAIVLGFRFPAAWAFPLLTKVTPGVGLLWFAVRREWRSLAIALGATLAIAAISAIVAPAAWVAWVELLVRSLTHPQQIVGTFLPVPLWVRLPLAAALIVWGARTDRSWVVPVASLMAMPVLWINVFAMLVAVVPLRAEAGGVPARRWLLRMPVLWRWPVTQR